MSIVPKEAIEVIAQTIGTINLSPDVLPSLASDVEYRLREIMQESIKCMRHSKRTTLTAEDVDSALKLRNVEPIYGFASGDPLRFQRAAGHKDLFYIDEKSVEFKDVIETPLPKAPLDTTVITHWLAIEGAQPAIPENVPAEAIASHPDNKKPESKEDGVAVDMKLPIKHVLSRELQLYFEKITDITAKESNSIIFRKALVSLATDSGLHPLVPYFAHFVADEVSRNLSNFSLLFALMRLVRSLLQNPHLHVEPYLHQLMPSVLTCLVAKRLGSRFTDNQWELRDFTGNLVGSICKRYGHVYHNLQARVTRTLLHTFLDPTKTLPQHYGAIKGLSALGSNVVRLLVLPNVEPYLQLLEPEMQLEKQKNELKRHEAWHVHGALMRAAGLCMYNRLKIFPCLPSPPARAILKSRNKVATATPNKRKASMDNLMQQPPLRKLATDGPMGVMSANPLPVDAQGTSVGYNTAQGITDSMPSQITSSSRRQMTVAQALKKTTLLDQIWKEGIDVVRSLPFLCEHSGEVMLSFVPSAELSVFL